MARAPTQTDIDNFVKAAYDGDIPVLAGWLNQFGTEHIDACSSEGHPALSEAAYNQEPEAALMLMDCGADVRWLGTGSGTYSPLICAASRGLPTVVRALLELGADVNEALPGCGYTPLHYAVMNGYPEVALMLLAYGADINAKTSDGWHVRLPLPATHAELGKEASNAVKHWKESDRDAWHDAQGVYDPGAFGGIRQAMASRAFGEQARQLTEGTTQELRSSLKITFKPNGATQCP